MILLASQAALNVGGESVPIGGREGGANAWSWTFDQFPQRAWQAAVIVFTFVLDGKKEEPAVVHQLPHARVLGEYAGNALPRGFDEGMEPQRLVHPLGAVMDGLQREASLQVTAIALTDAQCGDDVVSHFVAAAEDAVVHG